MDDSTRGFVIQNGTLIRASVKRPEVCVPAGIKRIGANAFANFHNLKSVLLPPGIKSIENGAFMKCEKLSEILLPEGLERIGSTAFYGCTSLSAVSLPKGLKKIGYAAFSGCSALADVVFPEGLQSIDSEAFYGCGKLTSLELPAGLKSIGSKAFAACRGLVSLTLQPGDTDIGTDAFAHCASLRELRLPETFTQLGKYGFTSCSGLYDKNGLLVINGRLCGYNGKSHEITLDKNIMYIEPGVFSGTVNLTMPLQCPFLNQAPSRTMQPLLTGDGSVITFTNEYGDVAARVILVCSGETYARREEACLAMRAFGARFDFEGYDRLFTVLKEPYNRLRMAIIRLETPYALSEEAEQRYTAYLKRNLVAALELLNGIGEPQRFFRLCKKVSPTEKTVQELIDLAQSNENTELVAFLLDYQNMRFGGSGYENLFSLDLALPAALSAERTRTPWVMRSGGAGLLERYRGEETDVEFPAKVRDVQINGIADLDPAVPENYKKLRTVVLPEGYHSIGRYAFAGCKALERIELPASLETVGDRAFENCKALKQLYLRNNVSFAGYAPCAGAKIGTLIFETNDRRLIQNDLFAGSEIDRLVIYGGRFIAVGSVFGKTYSYPTTVYCSHTFESMDEKNAGFRANCKVLPLTDFDETELDSPVLRALLAMEKRRMKQ